MDEIKYLGNDLNIIITNPIGSIDTRNGFIYPVNYGYLESDKHLEVYILGVYQKLNSFKGKCIAILKKIGDNKLIVTVKNKYYTDEQIYALIDFLEKDNYLIIRDNKIDDGLFELAESLNNSYKVELARLKKTIIKLIMHNINDSNLIEHLLDDLLNIPTDESERLYNFLCEYLNTIDDKSYKYYKLEFKKMWG